MHVEQHQSYRLLFVHVFYVDSRFTIDANAYNEVQWKRQIKQKTTCTSNDAIGTNTETIEAASLKRGVEASQDDSPAKRMKVRPSEARIGGFCEAKEASTRSSISCPTVDGNGLLQVLHGQLHTRRQDLLSNTAELQYKQACVDYLRSLVISRTASDYSGDTRCSRKESNTTVNANARVVSADMDCIDTSVNPSAESETNKFTKSWMGQAHKSCDISRSGFTDNNVCKSVFLQRLEKMELKYLTPVFGDNTSHSTASDGDYPNFCGDEVSDDDGMPTGGIVVGSIQYTTHPMNTMQLHFVEVSITATNTFAHSLYGVTASALKPHSHSSTHLHTTSGVVDCMLPNTTATIVAQFTLPQNVFATNESADISIHMALNWRECVTNWTQNVGQKDEFLEYSRILNGLTTSR